jgi:hypothetical protein
VNENDGHPSFSQKNICCTRQSAELQIVEPIA